MTQSCATWSAQSSASGAYAKIAARAVTDFLSPPKDGETPERPLIRLGLATDRQIAEAYAEYLGVVDYLRKPFALDRLIEAVNKAFAPPKTEE